MFETDSDQSGDSKRHMFNSRGSLKKLKEQEPSDEDENEIYDPRISKEDLKMHISGTILSMVNVNFENGAIEGLKQQICRSDEALIDDALDILVEEIFGKYALTNKEDGLNFEEWCEWFTALDGINEMLMGNAYVIKMAENNNQQ